MDISATSKITHLGQVNMDVSSGSSPIGMVVVMGRVVGEENHDRDVILPTATEVILETWRQLGEVVCSGCATWSCEVPTTVIVTNIYIYILLCSMCECYIYIWYYCYM